jgi:intergrase/recombinase
MTVTNQQLQAVLQALTSRADRIEERMKTYEEQAKEHTDILRRIETTVNGYEKAIRALAKLLKYILGVISVSAASILAYWVMGLLHIHLTP